MDEDEAAAARMQAAYEAWSKGPPSVPRRRVRRAAQPVQPHSLNLNPKALDAACHPETRRMVVIIGERVIERRRARGDKRLWHEMLFDIPTLQQACAAALGISPARLMWRVERELRPPSLAEMADRRLRAAEVASESNANALHASQQLDRMKALRRASAQAREAKNDQIRSRFKLLAGRHTYRKEVCPVLADEFGLAERTIKSIISKTEMALYERRLRQRARESITADKRTPDAA